MSEWIEIPTTAAKILEGIVSLFMSEWIEMIAERFDGEQTNVSLFMSEWIEMVILVTQTAKVESHSL